MRLNILSMKAKAGRRRLLSILFPAVAFGIVLQLNAADSNISSLHRLYDMAAVSTTNPVVACAKDCGIEIPVSELRAYVNAMPDTMLSLDGSKRPPLTLDQKRTKLENLIDEHFILWAG